jgi:ribonucleoside-diphosphate reductase alpha chain
MKQDKKEVNMFKERTGEGVEVYVDEGGTEWHLLDDEIHREDGPAAIDADGTMQYFVHGKLHRQDGPAIIHPDGREEFYLNGNRVLSPIEDLEKEKTFQADPEGARVPRKLTKQGNDPLGEESGVTWEQRTAHIKDSQGKTVFEQSGIETPTSWSQTAINIVANKYFRGNEGDILRESSVRQLIERVTDAFHEWGVKRSYFASIEDAETFRDELAHILITQRAAFNSPVWFNVGIEDKPQCSACFINSVDDTMESILDLAKTEGMLFKYGSGAGSNLSKIRSSKELLAGGGSASGPVSFMKGYDAFAGVIKSGGTTRRAAKMVILDHDHPDVYTFVDCKMVEEKKAWALIDAGYDSGFNVPGGAYDSIFFQNANHSVRVSDKFMKAVENDGSFDTLARRDGSVAETYQAKELWRKLATAAWECGDPGIQFDDVINDWHTCKKTDRIFASNPCSEYMFLDDSACNLASLNLMKFRGEDGSFQVEEFKHCISVLIMAQEIIVDDSHYPTSKIEKNSHDYRPLGLGYSNLGCLLMSYGLPYDSDEGRAVAGAITALMGGEAYVTSAEIAKTKAPFAGFSKNKDDFCDVMKKHCDAVVGIDKNKLPAKLLPVLTAARSSWESAQQTIDKSGARNSQVTVLAPCGTIGFMMDCDTTGIEPDIALVKYKSMVGGGLIKIVNQTVPAALETLGYTAEERDAIIGYLGEKDTIEGAPGLRDEHVAVFDCAFKPAEGIRAISPMGHVKMMGAVQPFLSGAISKTVNMPESSTIEDVEDIYVSSWKLGLKAVAIYRDGCKRSQPVSTKKGEKVRPAGQTMMAKDLAQSSAKDLAELIKLLGYEDEIAKHLGITGRTRLPNERAAITHRFSIGGHEGYLTVGLFETGFPGEIFCKMSKEGSTISGLMDCFSVSVSLALQYGVPLSVLVNKFSHTRFEPSGFTGNPHVPIAKSVADYIFRWLGQKFLTNDDRPFDPTQETKTLVQALDKAEKIDNAEREKKIFQNQADAPSCSSCGSIMVRNGACYKCLNCGSTSGCS